MNILFFRETSLENFSSKELHLYIHINYNIHAIVPLTYCGMSVEHPFSFELIQTENNNNKSNEQKIVLAYAKYSGDNIVREDKCKIVFYIPFGKKIELKKVCYAS
jgi:hypothetical protein